MQFYRDNIPILSSPPPKEIIETMTGGCGLWQISILLLLCIAEFIDSLEGHTMEMLFPITINFTCVDTNASQCYTSNGSKCENFIFVKTDKFLSYTEKFLLICDQNVYAFWMFSIYVIGMMIGFFLVGCCTDNFGLRVTMMMFIPIHTLTGLFIISTKSAIFLFVSMLGHGIFCTSLTVMNILGGCEAVGNAWRTLSIGLVCLARGASHVIYPYFSRLFETIEGLIAISSILPLTLLIPLLYYRDSPNQVFVLSNFARGEGILRKIAKYNRHPISPNIRIRPVQIIDDCNKTKIPSYIRIWKWKTTRRSYLSLICIYLFLGYCSSVLFSYHYKDLDHYTIFGVCGCLGCIIAIVLCHFISHKAVIGVFTTLKSIMIGAVLAYDIISNQRMLKAKLPEFDSAVQIPILFTAMKSVAATFLFTAVTAVVNITPRMFPTEARAIGLGFCASVAAFAYLIERILRYYWDGSIFVTSSVLLLSLFFESYACIRLWKVHNRELPDLVVDCVKFECSYKPTRFFTIWDNDSDEIEIKQLDLTVKDN